MPDDFTIRTRIAEDLKKHYVYVYIEDSKGSRQPKHTYVAYRGYTSKQSDIIVTLAVFQKLGFLDDRYLKQSSSSGFASQIVEKMKQIAPLNDWVKFHSNNNEVKKFKTK